MPRFDHQRRDYVVRQLPCPSTYACHGTDVAAALRFESLITDYGRARILTCRITQVEGGSGPM